MVLTGCAQEINSPNTSNPDDTTYDPNNPSTGNNGGNTGGSGGGGSYNGGSSTGGPQQNGGSDTTSSSTTCPVEMKAIPGNTTNQGAFCIDNTPNGGYPYPANYFNADAICSNQGKHMCYVSEFRSACGLGATAGIPNTVAWSKYSPAPIPYSLKDGLVVGGASCSSTQVVDAQKYAVVFWCCK